MPNNPMQPFGGGFGGGATIPREPLTPPNTGLKPVGSGVPAGLQPGAFPGSGIPPGWQMPPMNMPTGFGPQGMIGAGSK